MSAKAYLYDGTKKLRLKEAATDASAFKAQKAELKERTEENLRKAAVLQEKLYAAGQEGADLRHASPGMLPERTASSSTFFPR